MRKVTRPDQAPADGAFPPFIQPVSGGQLRVLHANAAPDAPRFVVHVHGGRVHAINPPKHRVDHDTDNPPGECRVLVKNGKALNGRGQALKAMYERLG